MAKNFWIKPDARDQRSHTTLTFVARALNQLRNLAEPSAEAAQMA
jgi:hypothetical protein